MEMVCFDEAFMGSWFPAIFFTWILGSPYDGLLGILGFQASGQPAWQVTELRTQNLGFYLLHKEC